MTALALKRMRERTGFLADVTPENWRAWRSWLLVWVVLANAGFALMWAIGAPPRLAEILAIGTTGLIVRRAPYWLKAIGFIAVMTYSILGFIAGLFNLAISSLLHSIRFFFELDPAQSIEYIVGGAAVAALVGLGCFLLRRDQNFTDSRLLWLAVVAVLSLAATDKWAGMGMRGHYKRVAVAGTPFTSAVEQSGFATSVAGPKRNLLLVVVESLGQPVGNAEMERLLFAHYRDPKVAARFELSRGTTTYYNSTTAGEMRELCGRWGDYYEVLEQDDARCLPMRLRKQGYATTAYHSFAGAFFERSTWYPHIGFSREIFGDTMMKHGARECGGVFPGACDRDIPQQIAAQLKSAKEPQFAYWLTLNSHLPVPPGVNLDVDHCERVSPTLARDYPMICRQFAIWSAIDAALVAEITAPDFPPTDILIVGDHMPPYFDRQHRRQFAPDRVPWLMLRWKGELGSGTGMSSLAQGKNAPDAA